MVNTNTPDSSTLPDALSEASDGTKAHAARTERAVLQRMLGIDIGIDLRSRQIADAILTRVEEIRGNVGLDGLRDVLQPNLEAAIRSLRGAPASSSFTPELQRVHVLSEAIWKSIPEDISSDMVFYNGLNPQPPGPDGDGRFRYELPALVTIDGIDYNVSLNLKHSFWVEAGPFESMADMIVEITGKQLESCGISVDPNTLSPNHALTYLEATTIVSENIAPFNGVGAMDLHQVQTEMRARHSQHRRLLEGSDNQHGAALAAMIMSQYRDPAIQNALGGGRAMPEVQADITRAQNRQSLLRTITELEQHPLQNVTRSLVENTASIGPEAAAARAAIMAGIAGTPIAVAGEDYTITGNTPRDVAQATAWLNGIITRVRSENAQYDRVYRQLAEIARLVHALGGNTGDLARYVTVVPGTPPTFTQVTAHFTSNENFNTVLSQVRADAGLELANDHDADLTRLRQEQKDVRDGKMTGLTGSAAQHAVICRFLENVHHLSPTDAAKAANYIRGRSKIDSDLASIGQEISDDNFRDNRTFWERAREDMKYSITNANWSVDTHAKHIIKETARGAGLSVGWRQPNWATANYRQLVTSYFALKKLYEGKSPEGLKLPKSQIVQINMREITNLLMQKHAVRMLSEFGPAHNITPEKMQELLKEPSKEELARVMEDLLMGDEPQNYKNRVENAIDYADKHVEWKRRTLKWAATGTAGLGAKLVGGSAKKGFEAGKWTAGKGLGAAKAVTYDAPKAVGKGIWNNKGAILTIGGLSLLGGPVAGVGAWYLHKQLSNKK